MSFNTIASFFKDWSSNEWSKESDKSAWFEPRSVWFRNYFELFNPVWVLRQWEGFISSHVVFELRSIGLGVVTFQTRWWVGGGWVDWLLLWGLLGVCLWLFCMRMSLELCPKMVHGEACSFREVKSRILQSLEENMYYKNTPSLIYKGRPIIPKVRSHISKRRQDWSRFRTNL